MASADWTALDDSLDTSVLARGAVAGMSPPSGGGTYVYALNSKVAAEGAGGIFINNTNNPGFGPTTKGGQITGAIKRMSGAAATGWSPFFFVQAQGTSVNDNAYLIGLEDADPARIVVVKGAIINGIPLATTVNSLMRSDASFDLDEWVHLRIDVIREPSDDILIKLYSSDLGSYPVGSPSWVALAGCEEFVDDSLGIATGSPGYTGGYMGIAMQVDGITRRSAFDYITAQKQT